MDDKHKRKYSSVWNVFTIVDDSEGHAVCKICSHTLSYKSSVTNLRKHVSRKHPSRVKLVDAPSKSSRNRDSDDEEGDDDNFEESDWQTPNGPVENNSEDYPSPSEDQKVTPQDETRIEWILEEQDGTTAPASAEIDTAQNVIRVSRARQPTFKAKKCKVEKAKVQSNIENAIKDLRVISQELNEIPADIVDEFDSFGKTVSCQLRQLPEAIALESIAYIQSYLVEQRLKVLNNKDNNR